MAFTEEQEKQILDFIANASKQTTPPEGDKEDPKGDNIVDEAKQRYKKDNDAKELNANLAQAIKFNLSIDSFIKDNEAILPKEAKALLDTVNTKAYSTDVEKANVLRKGLIDQFIELKENFDILPNSLKDKANRYKALTDDEKAKQSSQFWDIVEIGATHKVLIRKAEQLSKNGGQVQKSEFTDFEKRVFEMVNKNSKKD